MTAKEELDQIADKLCKIGCTNEDEWKKLNSIIHDLRSLDIVRNISYQGLYDEAREMALTLRKIDSELHEAASCEGDYEGGYPSSQVLPNMCKIMYCDHGYFRNAKYN